MMKVFPYTAISLKIKLCALLVAIISTQSYSATVNWIGTINGNWHLAANWDTGTVPSKFDEVRILGAISYNITITSDAKCKRLEIGTGVARLLIYPSGSLSINGQNTINTDLLNVAVGSVLQNYGTVSIKSIFSNLDQEALDLGGNFINETNGSLTISDVDFQAPNWSEINREAVLVRKNALFENDGSITIDDVEGNAMIVTGSLRNLANGVITLGANIKYKGIRIEGGVANAILDNYGEIRSTMNQGTASVSLQIDRYVTATNYGLVHIENATASVYSITLESDLLNTTVGTVEIIESSGIQIGELGTGIVKLINEGNISLENVSTPLGKGVSVEAGGILQNSNFVSTNGYAIGISVDASGDIINDNGAIISTLSSTLSGISNNGEISNYGGIQVQDCGNYSFRNYFNVLNHATGSITINTTENVGLRSARLTTSYPAAFFDNSGSLTVSCEDGGQAINNSNSSIFRSRGQILVTSSSRIINQATFEFIGTIDTPKFENWGTLDLLPSTLPFVFTGDVDIAGTVEFSISSGSNYDKVVVMGDVLLQCGVDVEFINSYIPADLAIFDLIECSGNRNGYVNSFSSNLSSLNHVLNYSEQKLLQLKYSPCGNTSPENVFIGGTGNWSNPFLWSLGHVPYPCERVLISGYVNSPRVLTVDIANAEISKLTIYDHAVVIIGQDKKLLVDRGFRTTGGKEAVLISHEGELRNSGELEVVNVQETEFIENAGLILNDMSILLENGYKYGVRGVFNLSSGIIQNNDGAKIVIRNMFNSDIAVLKSVSSSGMYIEDGLFESDYIFSNNNSGVIKGGGTIRVPLVDSDGTIQLGNTLGTLEIEGDLDLGPDTKLLVDIQGTGGAPGPNMHDKLNVTGHLIVRGEIEIVPVSSPLVIPTDEYEVINYGTVIGDFNIKTLGGVFSTWDISDNGNHSILLLSDADCINKSTEWVNAGVGLSWFTAENWQYAKVPKACQNARIDGRFVVEIEENAKVNIGYLEMMDATLNLRSGSKLNLHGNDSANGIIMLENAIIDSKGAIKTLYSDVNGKPSFKMNFQSELINNGSVSLESND